MVPLLLHSFSGLRDPDPLAVGRGQTSLLPRYLRLRADNRQCGQLSGLVGRCSRLLLGFNGACRDVRGAVARPNAREFLFLRSLESVQLQRSDSGTPPPGGRGWKHDSMSIFNGTKDSYVIQ